MRTYRPPHRMTFRPLDPDFCDEPELAPDAHEYEAARAELGAWASDEQVTERAIELMQQALDECDTIANECEAESRDNYREY